MQISHVLLLITIVAIKTQSELEKTGRWKSYIFREDDSGHMIWSLSNQSSSDHLLTAFYKNSITENGFAFIDIRTSSRFNNSMQAYAAGFAEGLLTRDLISHKLFNARKDHCPLVSSKCGEAFKFFQNNLRFMKEMIRTNPTSDYWQQVKLILLQLQGLEDGYHGNSKINFTLRLEPFGLMMLSSDHELQEILYAVGSRRKATPKDVPLECSGLIKLLPDYSDLFVGHSTWRPFSTMLKIIKHYRFHFTKLDGREYPGNRVAYTSEPGYLFSSNDWYILSSGLVTMETTIGNHNYKNARQLVTSDQILEWIRNLVANRLAADGGTWCQTFKRFNSGTYNNQWMIVDFKQFKRGKSPKRDDGLLFILEQIPGLIVWKDMTEHLAETTFWPSFNYPYFEQIQRVGRFLDYNGKSQYYQLARDQIFTRNQSSVTDIADMFKLMRYNNFKYDPLSKGDPSKAIASRYDLSPIFPMLYGATDAKVTDSSLRENFEMIAECGPTHDDVTPFRWSDFSNRGVDHRGMPEEFKFTPILVTWKPIK